MNDDKVERKDIFLVGFVATPVYDEETQKRLRIGWQYGQPLPTPIAMKVDGRVRVGGADGQEVLVSFETKECLSVNNVKDYIIEKIFNGKGVYNNGKFQNNPGDRSADGVDTGGLKKSEVAQDSRPYQW